MIYTKVQFGKALKEKLLKNVTPIEIAEWGSSIFWENLDNKELDPSLKKILRYFDFIVEDIKYELSHQTLNKIAEDLIAGKEVDLSSSEYMSIIKLK